MKILDRYVASSFAKNYVLSFGILIGLFIMLDMLFHFDDLMAIQTSAGYTGAESILPLLKTIVDYYSYQVFLLFVMLSGIVPIIAAAFTLMRMSRQNELSAILSAGVPLLKVARPIVIVAILMNAIVIVDQELLIPQLIPKLTRRHTEAGQAAGKSFPIGTMQDGDRSLLLAARYYPHAEKPTMEHVTIIKRNTDFLPLAQITADRAFWIADKKENSSENGGYWKLENARIATGLEPGGKPTAGDYKEHYRGSITPEEIGLYRSNTFVNLLSTERINQLLAPGRANSYGVNQLLRVKHSRITQPVMNIFLLLLAVPCVLTRDPGQLRSAAMKCLGLSMLGLGGIFACAMLAGQPPNPAWADRWPAMMAFIPIIIFGPLAVWMLDRVET